MFVDNNKKLTKLLNTARKHNHCSQKNMKSFIREDLWGQNAVQLKYALKVIELFEYKPKEVSA